MIDKLLKLKGLGVFCDALPHGAVELAKCTVVYGENGRGKTTLSRLLASLSTGDCSVLGPMRTICCGASPRAELLVSQSHYSLRESSWSPQPLSSVLVFDSDFVKRNVYTGTSVGPDHRRNLCNFALGEKGVELANEVERLNEEIKGITHSIGSLQRSLEGLLTGVMTLDDFLRLPKDSEIDARIADTQKLMQAARDADVLRNRPTLQRLPDWSGPTSEQLSVLTRTIEDVAVDAVDRTRRHIQERLAAGGEEWLRTGLQYVRDERCPFCDQSIGDVQLIQCFRAYFSQAYAELRQAVHECATQVKAACSELLLEQMRRLTAENEAAAAFWGNYVAIPELGSPLGDVEAALVAIRSGLLPAFEQRKENLLVPVEPSTPIDWLSQMCDTAVTALQAYNERVDQANTAIEQVRATASADGLRDAESTLQRLQLQKRRWEPELSKLCIELTRLRGEKTERQTVKDKAKQDLDDYMSETMGDYRAAVNDFLGKCNAAFRIAKMDVGFAGGEPRADYSIDLFGYQASVAARATDGPHFDTMLSDGDRRTLAFAFFLARLNCDPSLTDRIVVLDDPVASLDTHRTSCTVEAIVNLAPRCGQLIVLTHDPAFAMAMSDALVAAGMAKGKRLSVLRLARDGDWSTICACDPDELCQTVLERSIRTLEEFRDGPSDVAAIDAVRCIRPAVEGLLRLKYPRELRGARDFGSMVARIREAAEESRLCRLRDCVDELHAVCSFYATRYMHVDRPHTQSVPGDKEVLSWVKRALNLLDSL